MVWGRSGLRLRTGCCSPRAVLEFLTIPWFKLQPWTIVGALKIQPFGVLVASGILLGSRVAEWQGERRGVPRQATADFLLYTIMIGLGSAMLLNMVVYEPEKLAGYFRGDFTYPGLSSFGGFFGAAMAALYFRQKKGLSLLRVSDGAAFAFPLAWLFGRTGCFVVHDHPGIPTDFFLGVENYYEQGVTRHDLGLYEVIWSAAVFGLFLWIGDRKMKPGYMGALLFILYAPIRFFLDFLRETKDAGGDVRYGDLTPGQYWAFVMVAAAIAMAAYVRSRPTPEVYLHGQPPPDEPSAAAASASDATVGRAKKSKAKPKGKAKRRKK